MEPDPDSRLCDGVLSAALDGAQAAIPDGYPSRHAGVVVVAHIGTTMGFAAGGIEGAASIAQFLRKAADQIDPQRQ